MPKARNIIKRVRSVRNIRRITRTMEMVATSRFKKHHGRTVNLRPYTDALTDMVGDLVSRGAIERMHHPLLLEPHVTTDVLLVITSSRGLCGSYNSAVVRIASDRLDQLAEADYQVKLRVVGRQGVRQFADRAQPIDAEYGDFDELPDYELISQLADGLMDEFLSGGIGGVEIAYTQFLSSSGRRPAIAQILPLSNLPAPKRMPRLGQPARYEFVPSAEAMLTKLLPATVRLRVWQCFLDSAVSEQYERIAAMRSATENAEEMIHNMTVQYNRLRQSQITNELAEILGGRDGVT